MLLSLRELVAKHGLHLDGVVHCGARLGEEMPDYRACGITRGWFVEANPHLIGRLKARAHAYPGYEVIEALLGAEDDELLDFNITNNDGMSSSVLDFGTHPSFSPETVYVETIPLRSVTLDTLDATYGFEANFLAMDLQGYEGHVLRGASRFLKGVDTIYTEASTAEIYKGLTLLPDLLALVPEFELVESHWVGNQGWGDCVLKRR